MAWPPPKRHRPLSDDPDPFAIPDGDVESEWEETFSSPSPLAEEEEPHEEPHDRCQGQDQQGGHKRHRHDDSQDETQMTELLKRVPQSELILSHVFTEGLLDVARQGHIQSLVSAPPMPFHPEVAPYIYRSIRTFIPRVEPEKPHNGGLMSLIQRLNDVEIEYNSIVSVSNNRTNDIWNDMMHMGLPSLAGVPVQGDWLDRREQLVRFAFGTQTSELAAKLYLRLEPSRCSSFAEYMRTISWAWFLAGGNFNLHFPFSKLDALLGKNVAWDAIEHGVDTPAHWVDRWSRKLQDQWDEAVARYVPPVTYVSNEPAAESRTASPQQQHTQPRHPATPSTPRASVPSIPPMAMAKGVGVSGKLAFQRFTAGYCTVCGLPGHFSSACPHLPDFERGPMLYAQQVGITEQLYNQRMETGCCVLCGEAFKYTHDCQLYQFDENGLVPPSSNNWDQTEQDYVPSSTSNSRTQSPHAAEVTATDKTASSPLMETPEHAVSRSRAAKRRSEGLCATCAKPTHGKCTSSPKLYNHALVEGAVSRGVPLELAISRDFSSACTICGFKNHRSSVCRNAPIKVEVEQTRPGCRLQMRAKKLKVPAAAIESRLRRSRCPVCNGIKGHDAFFCPNKAVITRTDPSPVSTAMRRGVQEGLAYKRSLACSCSLCGQFRHSEEECTNEVDTSTPAEASMVTVAVQAHYIFKKLAQERRLAKCCTVCGLKTKSKLHRQVLGYCSVDPNPVRGPMHDAKRAGVPKALACNRLNARMCTVCGGNVHLYNSCEDEPDLTTEPHMEATSRGIPLKEAVYRVRLGLCALCCYQAHPDEDCPGPVVMPSERSYGEIEDRDTG